MYISEIVEINNYRNLTGKTITFNDTLNFLIGENNIGKTNILELINICLAIGKFAETDFMDITLPIKIKFKVKYSNEEIGYFEDNFDVDDSNSITFFACIILTVGHSFFCLFGRVCLFGRTSYVSM